MDAEKNRITIIAEYFYPEGASTAQLLTELAVGLSEDFDVSVITSYPNYLETDREISVDRRSVHDGVTIERVRATRLNKDKFTRRIINWITFSVLVFIKLLRSRGRGDSVLVLSNPPVLPMVVFAANRLRGFNYAYLVYDMYPDMAIALGMLSGDGIPARLWERAIRAVYRDTDNIVVLGESMERRLTEKMRDDSGFDPGKITVIPNWADGDFIKPIPKENNTFAREYDLIDKFTLLYSGNIGRYHELRTAIDAIGELEESGRNDIQMIIIGEGARKEEHQAYVDEESIENVRFLPFQLRERLPDTLTACDASLVGISPAVEGMCVSAKLYTSLAVGKPVLAVVPDGDEVARVVQEANCGVYVPPGNTERAVAVLQAWAVNPAEVDRLGDNARAYFEEHYRKEHAVEAYSNLFQSLASGG